MGADANTSRFIRPFLIWLFSEASPETISIYHGYIRKLAHPGIYAILAFWSWRAFRGSALEFLRKNWQISVFLIVVLVASIDEVNQSFNVMRTSSAYDVLLDIFGGSAMIVLLWVLIWKKSATNLPGKSVEMEKTQME